MHYCVQDVEDRHLSISIVRVTEIWTNASGFASFLLWIYAEYINHFGR